MPVKVTASYQNFRFSFKLGRVYQGELFNSLKVMKISLRNDGTEPSLVVLRD